MFSLILGILLTLGTIFKIDLCEGSFCPRTNLEPTKNCVDECIPSLGCHSSKKDCLCDGDCGFSCVQKGLKCAAPLPKRLANGRRIVNGTNFNASATFICDNGFTLSGSGLRRCRAIGTWDGSKPRCRKYCSDPGVAQFTRRDEQEKKTGFKTKTVLHYYCIPNYKLEGRATITCKDNGQWSNPIPKCLPPSCSSPILPLNSRVALPAQYNSSSGGKLGTRLVLSCESGYYKVGDSSFMTCNASGQWQISKSFQCRPRNCGDPGAPTNGERQGLMYHFTSRVSFSCHKCYKLVGTSYRVCQADGTWSDQQPVCERIKCKKLSNLADGKMTFTSTDCGAKAEYSCNKGYKLVGPNERTCDGNGQWTGATPNCTLISCGTPQGLTTPGLGHHGSQFHYDSVIHFTCQANYIMEGKNVTHCEQDGQWSNKVPQCLAPCAAPIKENLRSEQKLYRHGEFGRFSCDKGFILLGVIDEKKGPQCLNGTWKSQVRPYCKKQQTVLDKIKAFFG